MTTDPACPPGAHIHPVEVPTLVVFRGAQLALDDQLLALCPNELVAERLADLINQHGLLPVPDHVPATATPWPPPLAADRRDPA